MQSDIEKKRLCEIAGEAIDEAIRLGWFDVPGDGLGPVEWMAAEIERLRAKLSLCNLSGVNADVLTGAAREFREENKRLRAENAELRNRSPNGPPRERSDFEKDMMCDIKPAYEVKERPDGGLWDAASRRPH